MAAALLSAAGAHASSAEADFAIDPALVQSLSDSNAELIRAHPYLAHFRRGELNLYYVAAHHENEVDSETFGVIRRAFEAYPIRRVIVEGCSNGARELSEHHIAEIEREGNGESSKWGETDYAKVLGARVKARSVCGEPSVRQQLDVLKAAGYRKNDYFAFSFVRMIPTYRAQGRLTKERLEDLYAETIDWRRLALGLDGAEPFDYRSFRRWYRDKTGDGFDPVNISDASTAPNPDGSALQRISDVTDKIRNRFLARIISRELKRYKHVLVVYGNGHHAAQRRAVEAAMGEPIYEGGLEEMTARLSPATVDSLR